jgi:hypothetical protein
MMTPEEIELSKKLLHAQEEILELQADYGKLIVCTAQLVEAVKKHELLIDAMMIGKLREKVGP